MRYDDASQAGSMANDSTPVARPDVDTLAPGSFGPATGNAITGAGTVTGSSGADTVGDAPGHIVEVRGAGGATSGSGGNFQATGQYGVLNMDAEGNFSYVRNAGTPDGVQDVFGYTLADADGQTSATTLAIDISKVGAAQAAVAIPGVVNLPPGVQLSDIRVSGRDLVITMPDGSQMVIPGGAVFVPQLVIGDVQVPASNLAALLVESEPQPAAGQLSSSGGNFATDVPPLDPGVPLGDLIPPTEFGFPLPIFEEVGGFIDEEPEAGAASAQLDDDAQEGGNPGGVGDVEPTNDFVSGQLPGSDGDGSLEWALTASGTAPTGFSFALQPNGDVWVLQGADHVMTITVDPATGAYTVDQLQALDHPAGGDENDLVFVLNYTVTDDDGDVAVGTLTINVDDDTPVVSVQHGDDSQVLLTTDDSQSIPGDGDPDTAVTTANFSGVFSGTSVSPGADGAGPGTSSTYALAVTGSSSGLASHGVAINLFVVSGVVVGTTATSAGGINAGNTVFTVETTNTGIVTLTQYQQVDHPIGQDPTPTGAPFIDQLISMADGLVTLTRSETVVDGDGDSVTGSATVNIGANLRFTDDGPAISLADRGEPTLEVDETNLGTNDTESFAANFSADFGADGPAAAGGGITYALGINPGATGLIDTLTGQAVVLSVVGGQVVGTAGAGGPTVFVVSVDASGNVTLDQQRAVMHTPDSGPDQTTTLAADNLVTLTATATDFDGDTASQTLNIGLNLIFHDDAPDAQTNGNGVGTVTLDETRPEGTDTSGAGAPSGDASNTINLAAGFVTGGAVDFGADGAGTVTYSLVLSANGIGSGMYAIDPSDTSASDGDGYGRGTQITLSQSGNVITGSANGVDYFTITIDPATGIATFTQLDNIWQPTPGTSYDEAAILSTALASNLRVVQTVTDADGDVDTASIDIGQGVFQIQDDGPVAHNDSDTLPSGSNGPETGNVITGTGTAGGTGGAGADDTGEDTPVHITAISGTGGTDTTFTAGLLSIGGAHGTLTMDADGNYSYTRTDNVPGNLTDTFTYTLTDADGDTTTAQLVINMSDNVPSLATPPQANLDDDVVPGLNGNTPGGTGDDPPDTVGQNSVSGTLVGSGGDGDLDYFFSATQSGLPTGFAVGAGSDVDTLLITQLQSGSPVLVLTVQLNNETGDYTVTQNAAILHPAGNNENNIPNINVSFFAQDADGDPSPPATLVINVDDDTPTVNVSLNAVAEPVLTTDDAQTIGVNSDTAVSSANFGGLFNLTQSAGADGTNAAAVLSYALDVTGFTGGPAGVNSGLESHDADIFLYEISGKVVGSTSATLAGVNAGNTVFDVAVSSTGVVTLTQYQQIDHDTVDPTPTGSPFADHIVSLTDSLVTLTASTSLTDRDSDTATDSETVNIGANLRFTDDGPDAATSGTAVGSVTLDETRAEGTDTVGATLPNGDASATINFSVNFVTGGSVNYGADGPGSVTYTLTLNGATNVASGLYALDNTDTETVIDGYGQGGQIVLNQTSANTITGSFGGTNYFTLTIDPATGIVTFTQLNNIWHPVAGSSAAALDDTATLNTALASSIQVIQTVTDFDGDTDTASINIGQGVFKIQDDGPRFGPDVDTTLQVDNDATPSATGDLDIVIGTDSPNGGTGSQNPDDILVSNFAVSVNGVALDPSDFTLTPVSENATTASYTFTFDYDTGDGGTTTAEGTLVFNKAAGTYTVELTNGPLQAFSTFQTAQGTAFVGYEFDSTTPDNTQPAVAVTTIKAESAPGAGDGFYVQFTGFTAGNADHETINPPFPDATADGSWAEGDLFSEGTSLHQSWVSVSNSSNGVGGDTVNGPDALNFTLYSSDPKGDFNTQVGNLPSASASDMFLRFDGVAEGDDFIVVLKLWEDTDGIAGITAGDTFTTKAIVVEAGDMYLFDSSHEAGTVAALAGTQYEDVVAAIVADGGSNNNDGLVIIESNDYNGVGENWQIVGAQIVNTSAGVTGSGINLDPDVGTTGGSGDDGTVNFNTVTDTAPMKITNIGFISGSSTDQNATLEFDVTIHDADGDTATTSITVNIGDTSSNPLAAMAPLSTKSTASVSDTLQTTTNSNPILMGALAAAGLAASDPLAASGLHDFSSVSPTLDSSFALSNQSFSPMALDSSVSHLTLSSLLGQMDGLAMQDMSAQRALAFDAAEIRPVLDEFGSGQDAPMMAQLLQGTDGPIAHAGNGAGMATAAAISMPAMDQLLAGGLGNGAPSIDGALQHNAVVGQVLADALNGGSAGPNVDALINAISSGGGHSVMDVLASHAAGAVPNGDMGIFAGFTGPHEMIMDQMVMHVDAAPAQV